MAERVLMNEYKALAQESWTNIELVNENIFEWDVALIVLNPDSIYYGGYFKAKMNFPKNYPFSPPDFKFMRPLWHPNVYPDGRLCISILHPPGEDEMSGELASERWSPAQRVESVLLSILSLLDDAEPSSPANVDAGVMLRKDPTKYKEMIKRDLDVSKQDIPEGYVMPTHEDAFKSKKNDDIFMEWEDSDADSDFGASDSEDFDAEDDDDEEFDEDMDEDDSASDDGKKKA
ncbi:Ubiquitin-conjugating enzyme subunit [Diplodia seriata]|uniref:Ubiquitin-conjugating enzyme E2 2 n=2 Tax=Diplodia TaxID=66735 RepID=A0A0G2EDS3_9PEZI|nr:putative ubiquitin conjugating enzyme [Diplodia seriata]OMP89118.1 Ubiquitin-conjugating enzyme E2-34 kDa [Diplodia seriata]